VRNVRLDDGHRRIDRSVVFGQGDVEDLVYALPPRGEILKITAQRRRQGPVQNVIQRADPGC